MFDYCVFNGYCKIGVLINDLLVYVGVKIMDKGILFDNDCDVYCS